MEPTRHPRVVSGTKAEGALIAPLVEFAAAAVRNDRVDPITTELVRLTCARYHDCHT